RRSHSRAGEEIPNIVTGCAEIWPRLKSETSSTLARRRSACRGLESGIHNSTPPGSLNPLAPQAVPMLYKPKKITDDHVTPSLAVRADQPNATKPTLTSRIASEPNKTKYRGLFTTPKIGTVVGT